MIQPISVKPPISFKSALSEKMSPRNAYEATIAKNEKIVDVQFKDQADGVISSRGNKNLNLDIKI